MSGTGRLGKLTRARIASSRTINAATAGTFDKETLATTVSDAGAAAGDLGVRLMTASSM
ncbi:hypothetical protein BDI01nite_27100 [Brevundimonas diminuta]|nr:hypothetical protein BDI01nite_27100 [Brevundimonas diminuta]